jgi:DNA-directed RNA polymerase beta subunit
MFTYLKIAIVLIVISGAAGAFMYVKALQADLATSELNNVKLEQSVKSQKAVITQQLEDVKSIQVAMIEQETLNKRLNDSLKDLRDKFHKVNASGKKRDIGELAEKKPKLIQRVINTGTRNALRCMEISMGAKLTEKEKNATKKSEINSECSGIANPNYQPYGN